MRLMFVRHADPDYSNDTITEHGILEAKALAKRMQKEQPDEIYCSTMNRAKQTASYTCSLIGREPVYYDWLREVTWESTITGYSNPYDLPGEKLIEPEIPTLENWMKNPEFDGAYIAEDLKHREACLDAFLKQEGYERSGHLYLETKENHKKVVLFCHAGFSVAMISYLLNIPLTLAWADFWLAPTSVTTILFSTRDKDKVVPRCIQMGDTSHLYESGIDIKPRGLKGSFY